MVQYIDIAYYFVVLANFLPYHAHIGHFCNQLFCGRKDVRIDLHVFIVH